MKRNGIMWVLRPGTGAMWMMMYRQGDFMRIEASMCSGTSSVELSGTACNQLGSWLAAYHARHGFGELPSSYLDVGWEGVAVDVLPEHAERIGGSIAAFVTDPANHDPVDCGGSSVTVLSGSLATVMVRTWKEKHAKSAMEQAQKIVVSKFPALIADPLGMIPES